MKNKTLFLLPIFCLFLSSCFEMEETYNLNIDGSYTANYDVNMGGLMGLVQTMLPDSAKEKEFYFNAKDTTFNLFSKTPDSIKKKFSAAELQLISNTEMKLQTKMSEGIFRIGFSNKGKSFAELNNFVSNFDDLMQKGKVNNLISSSLGEKISAEAPQEQESSPFSNDEYNYTVTDHTFERKVKPEVLAEKQSKNEQAYQMIEGMNIKMTNTIVINLPKPAKSVENPNAVLSADKKQFKLVIDMFKALKDPSMLNFKVNY